MVRLLRHPVPVLLLCLSLAGTPVTYRGGASDPHPHMFLEFLMEARSGHFHHHHGEDGVDKAADGAFHHQHRASTPDAGSARSSPALDRFDGSVTPFTVSDVGRPGWVLTKQEFLEAAEMVTIIADDDFSAAGIASPPQVPPPQYPSF